MIKLTRKVSATLHTIHRISWVLVGVSFASPATSGTTLIEERFDYAGETLAEANGGVGWRDSWKSTPQLSAESLADLAAVPFPAPKGYPPAEGKRLALIDPDGQSSAHRGLAPDAFIRFDEDQTYFLSFLAKRNQGGYAVALRQGASTTVAGVNVSSAGAITLTLDGKSATSANVISNDTPYLFVLKIETAAEGVDRVFLNRYTQFQSLPAEEPETWLLTVATPTSLFAERVAFLGGSNRIIEFDEFRIGTTWIGTVYEVPSSFGLVLEQSSDLKIWNQVLITPDMISPDGAILPHDVTGNNFFRMRIDPQEDQ